MHAGALQPGPDRHLAPGLHDGGGRAEPLGAERRVPHPPAIRPEVADTLADRLPLGGVGARAGAGAAKAATIRERCPASSSAWRAVAQAAPRSLGAPYSTLATSLRCSLTWKRSTIWRAAGKASPARFQIQGAPSPRMTWRGARSKPRRGLPLDPLGERRRRRVRVARRRASRWRPSRRPSPRPGPARPRRPAPRHSRPYTASLPASWPSRRPACPAGPPGPPCASAPPCRPDPGTAWAAISAWGGHDLLAFVRGHRLPEGLGGPLHLFHRDGRAPPGSRGARCSRRS